MFTFDQIKEMKAQGITFESHTVSHPDLAQSDSSRQESELATSKQSTRQETPSTTTTIVYPSGRYSDLTMELAENNG